MLQKSSLSPSLTVVCTMYAFTATDNTANIEKYHCKDGWIKNGDACYLFATGKNYGVSWYGAKEFCESKGGFLADVLDQETQDFINKRTQQDYHTTDWWLGGNDIQKVHMTILLRLHF